MKTWIFAAAGALSALSTLAAAQVPAHPATPGLRLLLTTFTSTDVDRSTAFYTKGLGLTAGRRIESAENTEVPLFFPVGGLGLMLTKPKAVDPQAAGSARIGHVVIDVADLPALAARLKAAGYPLVRPISDNPERHVQVALVRDPDGNELELIERSR
jgi:lactoylglutathione lyase